MVFQSLLCGVYGCPLVKRVTNTTFLLGMSPILEGLTLAGFAINCLTTKVLIHWQLMFIRKRTVRVHTSVYTQWITSFTMIA